MGIKTPCISCGRTLSAPDSAAGKRARCPSCGTVQQLPAANPVEEVLEPEPIAEPGYDAPQEDPFAQNDAPSDEYGMAAEAPSLATAAPGAGGEGEQRRPCPMCGEMIPAQAMKCRFCNTVFDQRLKEAGVAGGSFSDPGWVTVRKGVRMIYVSIAVIFIGAILAGVLAGVAGASLGHNAPGSSAFPLIVLLPILVILGAAIAILVGQFMCCAVPAATGAKNLALIAAVCIIANILCSLGAAVFPPLQILGSLASLTGNVLFILFLRKVALYLGNGQLASSAMGFLIFLVVFVVSLVVVAVLATQLPALMALVGLAVLVCGITAFVWYMRLLRRTVETIDNRGTGGRRAPSGFPVIQR